MIDGHISIAALIGLAWYLSKEVPHRLDLCRPHSRRPRLDMLPKRIPTGNSSGRFQMCMNHAVLLDGLRDNLRWPRLDVRGRPFNENAQVIEVGCLFSAHRTIRAKLSGFKQAPPTKAPSTSFCAISSRAFSGLTLPPYWIRTPSAVVGSKVETSTDRIN